MAPQYELDNPTGPQVTYAARSDDWDFSDCPAGWRPDFSAQFRLSPGVWRAPLVAGVTPYNVTAERLWALEVDATINNDTKLTALCGEAVEWLDLRRKGRVEGVCRALNICVDAINAAEAQVEDR